MNSQTVNGFGFSGVNIDTLTNSKYCLAAMSVDMSGSVSGFQRELENAANIVIQATKKSSEAENIMLRTTTFSGISVDEVNGFTPVTQLPDDQYSNKFCAGGTTPLVDASVDAVEAIESYGKQLIDQDYMVNGILFVITDGEECSSRLGDKPQKVKEAIARVRRNEAVESLVSILVGVNDSSCKAALNRFCTEAGFDHFISIGDATPAKLAKLGALISQSVSSQSQSIGSGGPSQACNFSV